MKNVSLKFGFVSAYVMAAGCASGTNPIDLGVETPDASLIVGEPDAASLADAGPLPTDAGQPPDDAASCMVLPLTLLANGDFDLGPGTWAETSAGGFNLVSNQSKLMNFTADSGSFVAWMGGYSQLGAEDTLQQDITVPTDATPLTFSGKVFIDTEELGIIEFDFLRLEIIDLGTNTVLETLKEWSDFDADLQWVPFSTTASGAYAGQTVGIRFTATMDSSNSTAFILDTWAADTTSCQ